MRKTSLDAYASLDPTRISDLQRTILDRLQVIPMTDEELYDRLQADGVAATASSVRTRRAELVAGGFVRDAGSRRKSRTGRLMIVWQTRAIADPKMRRAVLESAEASAAASRRLLTKEEEARLAAQPWLPSPPRVRFGQTICRACNGTGGNRLDGPCWGCGGEGVL